MNFNQYFVRGMIVLAVLLLSLGHSALAAPAELTLSECISLALKNNSSLKMAEDDTKSNFWAVHEAQGNKGLSLNFKHTDTRSKSAASADTAGKPASDLFTNQVILSLPLYSGGKYENLEDVAKLNYKVAELNMAATKQQIKFTTTSSYYQVLQYQNLVAADRASVDDYTLHVKNLQIGYDAGSTSKLQVMQEQDSLAHEQETRMKDQLSYHAAFINLKNIIGLSQTSDIVLKGDLKCEKYPLPVEECVQYALKNSPVTAGYNANITIAADNLKIANSGKLPTLSLDGYEGWQDSRLPGTKNNYFSVYLTASYDIFDSGITNAKVKQAEVALHKAQETLKQANDKIYVDVSQYYLGMQEAEKRMETSSVSVTEAKEVVGIANIRFNAGLGTNQDILDAEVALTTARNNYIQAMYDYNTNKAGLEAAMGMAVE